jgi:hypothetical protein
LENIKMTRSFYPWQDDILKPFLPKEEVLAEMGIDICDTIRETKANPIPRLMG